MTPTPEHIPDTDLSPQAGETTSSPELTNPKLGATLRADYEALRNDVQQATDLASDFQRELAGKSNELAHLKRVFEKTNDDLLQLQAGITELREERHRLANEALRAVALERRVSVITADRDRLHAEVEILRQTGGDSANETARRLLERDAEVAQLGIEVESLRQRLAFAGRAPGASAPLPPRVPPEIEMAVGALADAFEKLLRVVHPEAEVPAAKIPAPRPAAEAEEFIDIPFGK